jgi:Methyltransferase domain
MLLAFRTEFIDLMLSTNRSNPRFSVGIGTRRSSRTFGPVLATMSLAVAALLSIFVFLFSSHRQAKSVADRAREPLDSMLALSPIPVQGLCASKCVESSVIRFQAVTSKTAFVPNLRVARAFDSVYSGGAWGTDGAGSGFGSSLAATATARAALEMLIFRHGVTTVLDAPCGSSHWWPPLLQRVRRFVPCFRYHGMDVVPGVIEASQRRFHGDNLTTFAVGELSTVPMPSGADLVLCRDALQHLPLLVGISLLENIARSKPRLVVVGSYLGAGTKNVNIKPGEYFDINLSEPPFNMTQYFDAISENTPVVERNKYLLVFEGTVFQSLNFDAMKTRAQL